MKKSKINLPDISVRNKHKPSTGAIRIVLQNEVSGKYILFLFIFFLLPSLLLAVGISLLFFITFRVVTFSLLCDDLSRVVSI